MRQENDQLTLQLRQMAGRADKMDRAVTGRFLTGEERSRAVHAAHQAGVEASFDGGWEDAERVQVCFHPAWEEPSFTARWMEIRWNAKFSRCDHRDLLGSLMALGMDRSFFGDLIAMEDHALLYTLPEMCARLPFEWTKAGNTPIAVRELETAPVIEAPEGSLMHDTVASLRLDAVLASGMKLSRTKAAEMIREGLVAVEHMPEIRTDRALSAGQLLSVRGFGRIRIAEVGNPTRKDRLPVTLEIFRKQ